VTREAAWSPSRDGTLADGAEASVCGGVGNTASGRDAAVSGGAGNIAVGRFSTVGGGLDRTTLGDFNRAAGEIFQPKSPRAEAKSRWGVA
jgi:hypothetical protein